MARTARYLARSIRINQGENRAFSTSRGSWEACWSAVRSNGEFRLDRNRWCRQPKTDIAVSSGRFETTRAGRSKTPLVRYCARHRRQREPMSVRLEHRHISCLAAPWQGAGLRSLPQVPGFISCASITRAGTISATYWQAQQAGHFSEGHRANSAEGAWADSAAPRRSSLNQPLHGCADRGWSQVR